MKALGKSWQALKLRFPLEKLLKLEDLQGLEAISSKGAFSQETLQQGLEANAAERTHPLIKHSIQDEVQLGVVAGLMGCKVCHQLVTAVWNKARQEIHSGLGVPSISKINRQLWHTCEKEVSKSMLKDWSIILMGTPLMTTAGAAEEGLAYVFKARDVEEEPSDFEQRALLRSCTDIQEGQESGEVHFATELVQKLGDYEKAWSRLRTNAGLGPVRKASVLDHNRTPDGKACKDYHKQCAWWADKGECAANARYMVGSDDQEKLKGFCRLSCGACSPSAASGLPDEMEAELEEESAALLAAVDTQLCAKRQVCNGLSGDAHRAMDTANTGGAASAGSPGPSADVIAAARNMVRAQMRRRDDALTELDGPHDGVSKKGALAGGQGETQLKEVAANCYYVNQGWWSYELCPGHHLGQFHASEETQRIESALSLGRYNAVQEGNKGAEADRPVPMLPVEDMLPGLTAGVPAIITTYSGGASCDGSDAAAKRSAKVQLVCSPDAEVYMLVREPETCRYVVTLYHPSICDIDGYQHRQPAVQEKQMETLRDMMASVAGRGHEEL
ncbi:g2908 [Coccomyxa elongata]